jgi:hypothetical protein
MELQQKQLDQLNAWLNKMESKIGEHESVGTDVDVVRHQVEEHKVKRCHFTMFASFNSFNPIG